MVSNCCEQNAIWKRLQIDGRVHMICFIKEDEESWKVLLTDLMNIWIENLTHESIFHKCQTLNPLLNLHEAPKWKQSVLDMLSDVPQHVVEASVHQINLRKNMDFVKLKFSLDFVNGTPQQFWQYVTEPLCLSSMEMIRQHKILLNLVKCKDEEIAEYKADGAELVRKYIATKPYSEELFRTDPDVPVPDLMTTFQSMLDFYNTTNLPNSQIKIKTEATSTTSNGGSCSYNEIVRVGEDAVPGSSRDTFVGMKQEGLGENEQSRDSKGKEHPSMSKTPILKLRGTSHTIAKSLKKKKTLSDFIS